MSSLKRLLSLIALMSLSTTVSAATLVHSINGYTPTAAGILQFDALLIDDNGRVVQTMDASTAESYLAQSDITKIDGKGRTLLPGLIDSHGHILSYGRALTTVDLRDTQSAEDAVNRVAKFMQENPEAKVIIGRGWNQVLWPGKKFPNAELLDAITPDVPVALNRIDGHAMWVNSAAMKMAGITKETLDPDGGEFIRDRDGNPTGILIDNAMNMIEDRVPLVKLHTLPKDEQMRLLKIALDALAAEGLTSVHDAGISPETVDAFKSLGEQGELSVRVYAMLDVTADGYLETLNKGPEPSLFDDRLSVRSVKISIDGALGSRGAALDEPYTDRPDTRGLLLHTEKRTEELTLEAMKAGFQVNSHAIGDRGNRLLLDIFAKYPKYRSLRNRIEHAQIVHVEDLPRFKELGVIPSMQPTHATSDKNMAEDRVGKERLKGAYAWRSFLNMGVRIAGGSDFPVEPANPMFGLHAAVTRQDRESMPEGGWIKEQKMSRGEALKSFTIDAAYAAHQDNVIGSLEQGKWADFILVDDDFFEAEEEQIWQLKVMATYQAGKAVYQAEESEASSKDG